MNFIVGLDSISNPPQSGLMIQPAYQAAIYSPEPPHTMPRPLITCTFRPAHWPEKATAILAFRNISEYFQSNGKRITEYDMSGRYLRIRSGTLPQSAAGRTAPAHGLA